MTDRPLADALSARSSACRLIAMRGLQFATRVLSGLERLSLLALGASHLALTDIAPGEPDLRLEWNVLRISGIRIALFILSALAVLRRTAQHTS